MPTFIVRRVRDGKPLTTEKILAGSAESAATQIVGEALVTKGKPGQHVAEVRLPKSLDWTYFWMPPPPASRRGRV